MTTTTTTTTCSSLRSFSSSRSSSRSSSSSYSSSLFPFSSRLTVIYTSTFSFISDSFIVATYFSPPKLFSGTFSLISIYSTNISFSDEKVLPNFSWCSIYLFVNISVSDQLPDVTWTCFGFYCLILSQDTQFVV